MEPLSEGRASQGLPSFHQGIPKAGGVHWDAALLYKPQEETDDSAQVKSSKLLFNNSQRLNYWVPMLAKILQKKVMAGMKFLRKRPMEKRCHMMGLNHY